MKGITLVKKILILLMSIFVVFIFAACDETNTGNNSPKNDGVEVENNESEDNGNENIVENEEPENEPEEDPENTGEEQENTVETEDSGEDEPENDNVPREHRNALKSAQNYLDFMPFSEKGLFEQLTSEYGDQYPEEAAQYAIENVEVDYNEQALKAAENYQELIPMSDKELFDQLTSEYGDQYTEEQAKYAIDHLDD